ncbi:MAG: GAF domain-containing protein [Vicinamibacteria bacterium]|jgi:PAS domain S-box-containing protein|nr:GAF domain-containing protein [Vicinamibacteria bacterium]
MHADTPPPGDAGLYRRGALTTVLNRGLSLALGFLALFLLWHSPHTRPEPALAVGVGYAVFATGAFLWLRKHPRTRWLKVAHDAVDALAIGAGAYCSGGLESPIWLLLYPHVVAVSIRKGLAYALAFGALDATLVVLLLQAGNDHPEGGLHAVAIVWCAVMAGSTSSYLRDVQRRLHKANESLQAANARLGQSVDEQGQTLQALGSSEQRYRRLLERIQDGVLIIQDGRVVYANEVFQAMTGLDGDSLAGREFGDLVPADDRPALAQRYGAWEASQATAGGFEARLLGPSGEPLLVQVKAGSVEFEGRRSVIATIRDVTRERRMEQEVKAQAERLAAINEVANAVNLSLTLEDVFAVAAEEARRLVPFDRLSIATPEESGTGLDVAIFGATNRRTLSRAPAADVAWALLRPVAWCAGGPEPQPAHLDELMACPDTRAIASVPLISKGRVIGCLCVGRNRPEGFSRSDLAVLELLSRHVAIALDNARLLDSARRRTLEFESLLEVGSQVLERNDLKEILPLVCRSVNQLMATHHCLVLLRDGDLLHVAAQEGLEPEVVASFEDIRVGESLSGWVLSNARPLAIEDMLADPRLKFAEMVQRYGYRSFLCVPMQRRGETLGTLEVVTKAPRQFTAEEQELMAAFAAEAAIAIDNARLLEEARLHLEQATENNRRLQESDRQRQQYLRNVSHEFRTPLTVIKGYAEFLRDSGPVSEKAQADAMRVIAESCDRVIDMVDTLIEVSRIEQGMAEQTLQIQEHDLADLVLSGVEPLRSAVEKKGLVLDVAIATPAPRVRADGGLLTQVVRKLVDNAVKYTASGGRVLVRGRLEGDDVVVEVEDSGVGIAPEHLPRIFDKFYMADGGINRRAGGTGVGLYLVREIVRLHAGQVSVDSRPGGGSLFVVRLPLGLARPRVAQAASA